MNKDIPITHFIGFLAVCLGLFWFWAVGWQKITQGHLQNIQGQVARDAVEQYNIASRHGGHVDNCVQAGIVAAAYLQAKDENQYSTWKVIQHGECALAGVPTP